jgi:hypothetical protein
MTVFHACALPPCLAPCLAPYSILTATIGGYALQWDEERKKELATAMAWSGGWLVTGEVAGRRSVWRPEFGAAELHHCTLQWRIQCLG